MSIFDLFDDKFLAGDNFHRKVRDDILEYEHYKADAEGVDIFVQKARSMKISLILCLLIFLILIGQLLRLQIAQGSFNRTLAEGNRMRLREIPAPRGLIYSSSGEVLAKNKVSFDLEIYPLDLPRVATEKEEIFIKLSQIAQIPQEEIKDKVDKKGYSTYDPIVLKENLDRDTAMILEYKTVNLPGVVITKKPVREYLTIPALGHILGYIGKMTDEDLKNNSDYRPSDQIGKAGLEDIYEEKLKGIPGLLGVEVDSRGRQQRQVSATNPLPGNNLYLGLDAGLEAKIYEALSAQVEAADSPGGAAVALNPQNGQILAMVSVPGFDNNIFSSSDIDEQYQALVLNPSKPMFNRAISGTYPSGSIIKPVVAAAGLQEGVITASTTINAPGEIKVGNWTYPDWKVHGLTDVRKAIAESVNIFFYALSGGWDKIRGLGIAKMDEYLGLFGFGQITGIDLTGEVSGLVPSPEWKEKNKQEMWYLGDTYHLGIGQGDFLVTPLQMAVAYGAITNGGQLLKPEIVSKITDKDGQVIWQASKAVLRQNFISAENLQIIREGMRQAVTSGSAQSLSDLPVAVAAKTGTAQFGAEGKTHAWMAAFAPYKEPQIVIVVLVEEGGEGYATAGPVVNEVFNWYFNH